MKTKWFFILILVASLTGSLNAIKKVVPNQKIVLQFTNSNLTTVAKEKTIASLQHALEKKGVHAIEINTEKNGTISISYFSESSTQSIKNTLANATQKTLQVAYTLPQKSKNPLNTNDYNLEVINLHNTLNIPSGFAGKAVLIEGKMHFESTYNPTYFTANIEFVFETKAIPSTTSLLLTNSAIALYKTMQKIPEGRAGPKALTA